MDLASYALRPKLNERQREAERDAQKTETLIFLGGERERGRERERENVREDKAERREGGLHLHAAARESFEAERTAPAEHPRPRTEGTEAD